MDLAGETAVVGHLRGTRGDATALLISIDHAQWVFQGSGVEGRGGTGSGQVLGDVDADAAGPDDRDPLAGLGAPLEQVRVADDLGSAVGRELDDPRRDAVEVASWNPSRSLASGQVFNRMPTPAAASRIRQDCRAWA